LDSSLVHDRHRETVSALVEQAWSELRELARRELRSAGPGGVGESASSLLGEAMVQVLSQRNDIRNAAHLRGLTVLFLRRLIVDRRRASVRRAELRRERMGEAEPASSPGTLGTELAEALAELGAYDERKLAALTMSAIHGLKQDEIAMALDTSVATVERDLRFARAWVATRISDQP